MAGNAEQGSGGSVYRRAGVIALAYVAVALCWIIFSDAALESLASDVQQLSRLQTYKGWFFVGITGILLFAMTSIGYRAIFESEARYRALAADLEIRVAERTRALEAANRDLTEAIASLERVQNDLIQAEKLAALGALVAGIAHELGTPVGNGVITASALVDFAAELQDKMSHDALRRSDLTDFFGRLQTGVDLLQRNLRKAADLITSFKQVAVDRTSLQRRRFGLAEVVRETLTVMSPRLRKLPHAIDVDIADDIELDSYPGAVGQIISNLVENAIVHGLEGRPAGRVLIAAQRAASGAARDMIRIDVSDDGAGIPRENLGRVFDPFFTTRLGQGGSGLGLHIVHNLVTGLLGGRVAVESTPGHGATFHLHLPEVAPDPR